MNSIKIKKQGIVGWCADMIMLPLMYALQGTLKESPQRTHRWNNSKLSAADIRHFDQAQMVSAAGDHDALQRWIGPFPVFHMPILGGWDEFVVIEPCVQQSTWFIGWVPADVVGVSRIPLTGPVRVLIGPRPVQFFGVDAHGQQIAVKIIGRGKVRNARKFATIPLL